MAAQLTHLANGVLEGIHDVFLPDDKDADNPVALKKLLEMEVVWVLHKDILGFMFNSVEKMIWLNEGK